MAKSILQCVAEMERQFSPKAQQEQAPMVFKIKISSAEYLYLSEHINDLALKRYIDKAAEYSFCKSYFRTILRWAMQDGYFSEKSLF